MDRTKSRYVPGILVGLVFQDWTAVCSGYLYGSRHDRLLCRTNGVGYNRVCLTCNLVCSSIVRNPDNEEPHSTNKLPEPPPLVSVVMYASSRGRGTPKPDKRTELPLTEAITLESERGGALLH